MIQLAGPISTAWADFCTHVWQSTLLLGLLLLSARLLRNAPARVAGSLLTAAFLKLLVPLSLLQAILREGFARFDASPPTPGRAGIVLAAVLDPLAAGGVPPSRLPEEWILVASAVWITGMIASLLALGRAVAAARRVPSQPLASLGETERARILRVAARGGVPSSAIAWATRPDLPYVCGLFRPGIVIPDRLVRRLGDDELLAILLHEDAHRRRRDPLRETLVGVVCSVYFFHPLVAHLRRRMLDAIEIRCDAHALDGGIEPNTYARAIAIAVRAATEPRTSFAASRIHREGVLRERLDRVLKPGRFAMKPRDRWMIAATAGIALLVTLAPLPWLAGCAENDAARIDATTSGQEQPAPSTQPSEEYQAADVMPALLKMDPPSYPEEARANRIEGTVMVRALVGTTGLVKEAHVVEGHESLAPAALKAVTGATFQPAQKDGTPVETWVQVPIKFALN